MLARSLIVLLVVLNLGVALWWLARGDTPDSPAPAALPAGVARLQLVGEPEPPAAGTTASALSAPALPAARVAAQAPAPQPHAAPEGSTPEPSPSPAAAQPAPAAALQCYALGPFADAEAAASARRRLQPRVARLHVRQEVPSTAGGDWRVWLPPQADRAAAQALVERIKAAGFNDYYIIASGDEANSIALGLYGSGESARRHQAALQAAGFADVRAAPLGEVPPPETWIDVASVGPLTAADARALAAGGLQPRDCRAVPAAPPAGAR